MVMEMSKTYQYRKVMKPLLERKRRARINKCLDDLKDLMVECLQQEGEHVTRLEKADILELTVEHMRKLRQRGSLTLHSQASVAHVESFRSGYVHAADQISQVLLQQHQTDDIGAKVMKFLSKRLIEMQSQLLRSATESPNATTTLPPAALPPAQSPSVNVNYFVNSPATVPSPISPCCSSLGVGSNASEIDYKSSTTSSSLSLSMPIKENDLIDIVTVDNGETDTASVISEDSENSESVWRPW